MPYLRGQLRALLGDAYSIQRDAAVPGAVLALIPFDGFGDTGGVAGIEQRLAALSAASIVRPHESTLGDTDASTLFSSKVQRLVNGVVVEETVPQHPGSRLRNLFDALLYLARARP